MQHAIFHIHTVLDGAASTEATVLMRAVRNDKAVVWVEDMPLINCACGTKTVGLLHEVLIIRCSSQFSCGIVMRDNM
jgi:hypothetical protein